MMTNDEKKIWTLISAYDNLIEEEHFALKKRDFQYAELLIQYKQDILNKIDSLEQSIDLKKDLSIQEKFKSLYFSQKNNESLLSDLINEIQSELNKTSIEINRLQAIQSTYTLDYKLSPSLISQKA